MVPASRLSINPLLRVAAVTLTLVPRQTRTSPPRSRRRLAAERPAEPVEPLPTRVPLPARITEPCTVASVAKTSPIDPFDCSWAAAVTQRDAAKARAASAGILRMRITNDIAGTVKRKAEGLLLCLEVVLL